MNGTGIDNAHMALDSDCFSHATASTRRYRPDFTRLAATTPVEPPTDPAVVTVTLVHCSQPHLAEVYLRADIPVNEALSDVAGSQCDTGFTAYTGMAVAGSGFTTTYLIDSDQDRTDNNPYPSTVICLLQDAQGRSLSSSAKA